VSRVSVTIDGRAIAVESGTTVLEAARRLDIVIPTLCFVEGLEPAASCFVCAVQVEGQAHLSPACALPVADGMVVTTNSEDVRAARRMALELLLSDHAGDCIAPCRATCPAGLDIPGFVYELASDQNRRAMEIIADRLALPGTLGRICPRLCENECHRDAHDEGLAIAALHRFAADRDLASGAPFVPARAESSGKRVAIVGAGPAGLAAAYYLLPKGHACTLLDAQREPGGMLRYGIPAYRLPRAALDAEVELIRRLGAEFRMNVRWGADFTLVQLREQFDAVFIAIGAQGTQQLRCPGDELALSGIELLGRVANGERPEIGDDVVVVGGGNTAMDAARTAVRLGAKNVNVLYRRTRNEMPCLLEEVEDAEAEGAQIDDLVAPTRLERMGNGPLRLTCQRMRLGEADASGRPRPVPIRGSEFVVEAATVIAAIGQSVDIAPAASEGLDVTDWGIAVDPNTLATSLPGVFAGGDGVSGADLAVSAVAAGRLAAVSIDQYLNAQPVVGSPEMINVRLRALDDQERAAFFRRIEQAGRVRGVRIDIPQRLSTFEEVEARLAGAQVIAEARRCLTCGCRKADACHIRRLATEYGAKVNRFVGERRRFVQDTSHSDVIYEPGKCIMCEACVRIALEVKEELGLAIVGRGFHVTMAVPFDGTLKQGLQRVAERCVQACPTGALALRTQRACELTIGGRPLGDA
jgi:formate dehydrogenase major subunit